MGVNESTDTAWIQATRANSLGTYDKLLLNPYGGNVGIGTSSPTGPLHVSGSTSTVPIKIDNTGTGGDTWRIWSTNDSASDGGGKLGFYNEDTATRAMTLDSSGNVGIGVTNPTQPLTIQASSGAAAIALNGRSSDGISTLSLYANDGTTSQGYVQGRSDHLRVWAASGDFLSFGSGGSESARFDAAGNLLVGTTSQTAQLTVNNGGNNYPSWLQNSSSSIDYPNRVISSYATGGQTATMFSFLAANGDVVGTIKSTVTTTAYNTSSDQRLKENIADADDAGSKVDAIQVRQYDWKADGSHQDYGMIAQELQTVAPEAVSGDADSEEMMGVDYSKLVPMLIKEIQSLRNRVAQLEE